ncbi:MAG: tryptophan synthase subunit alpha [Gammaproteobacteria bacterium]|nr:tryptophan synthase subunit alpha [Gammaproteobacteria bacterium]
MSRIEARFKLRAKEGRKLLIPYFTAGDPIPENAVPMMHAMVEAGADLIELGVPFSDPMAEGPVIQKAMERALEHNVSLRDVIAMVAEFRQKDAETPVILMGYLNPVEVMGYAEFAKLASKAGVDGILTVDIPPEEAIDYVAAMKAEGIDRIFLISPTTSEERIKLISDASGGFLYYVSLKGVTGAGHLDVNAVQDRVSTIRTLTELPVGVGFGIKDAESAASIASAADAVVVGSAIVKRIEENLDSVDNANKAVCELLAEMRQALDS